MSGRLTVIAAVSLGISFGPTWLAHADDAGVTTLRPVVEAWFQTDPACLAVPGCPPQGTVPVTVPSAPLPNPYPAGTMHVGVDAGKEVARTYMTFPFERFQGAEVLSARLDVPLDTAAGDGSNAPDTSSVLVCTTQNGALTASEGTTQKPPAADCSTPVAMRYVASPSPMLEADLTPLAAQLSSITGLVLLPNPNGTTAATWRVVYSAHTRSDSAATPPASLQIVVQRSAGATGSFTDPVATPGLNSGVSSGVTVRPPIGAVQGGAFSAGPPAQTPLVAQMPTPATSSVQPVAFRAPSQRRHPHALLWWLPLAAVAGVAAVTRILNADLGQDLRVSAV